MSIKQIRWHSAVLALTIVTVLAALFALATVTSHADDVVGPIQDEQGNWSYTMKNSMYSLPINLEEGKTTTIYVEGKNTLTYADHCIEGTGDLEILGNGTLEVPNSSVKCNDFTIGGGAKLILGSKGTASGSKAFSLSATGNVTVDNAEIEFHNGLMKCGQTGYTSLKHEFKNSTLYFTDTYATPNKEKGLILYNNSDLTDCNVGIETGCLNCPSGTVTIDGGTYNFTQYQNPTPLSMDIQKAVINNASITANSPCFLYDLEMTDTNFKAVSDNVTSYAPSIVGTNATISGCKIKTESVIAYSGIHMSKNLTIKDNTEIDVIGRTYGIYGENVHVIHSSGKIVVVDNNEAIAAVGAIKIHEDEHSSEGTITLEDVNVKEPAGGTAGLASVQVPNVPFEEKMAIAAILDGKTPAMTVVLEADHTWDAGKVTKQPTTSEDGEKICTCSICGETKTEAIPKLAPQAPANGEDGTPFGRGASVEAAEAAILALPNDNDPAGTAFGLLQLKATKVTKNSVKLNWKAVPGATKYILFANKCGTGNKYKKLGVVTGTSYTATQAAGAAIQKGTYYKFMMIAADSNGRVVSTSKTVHAATKGGKIGNHKKVTVKKSVTKKAKKLKKGKTLKLKAKAVPQAKKLKVRKHRGIKYETSNPAVAQVNGKGTVKGVGKGTCYIYAYAQNGTSAKVKVTVK